MKANELMAGDLLRVNKDVCLKKGTIVEVRGIDADNAFPEKGLKGCATCVNINDHCEFGGVWVDFLEPIPLTPEILEKNGFTDWADHSRTTHSCSMLVDKTNIIVQKIDGTDYIFTQIHRCGADSCEFRMDLKYVHELQHALKFCKIEKEIEL